MKRFWHLGLFIACATFLASEAQADVANFEARCTWNASYTAFTCEFDSTRPESNPTRCENSLAPLYRWTFGDGSYNPSGSSYGYASKPNHTYQSPPPGTFGYIVKLKIKCFQSAAPESYTYAEQERYICAFGACGNGNIRVNGTWY